MNDSTRVTRRLWRAWPRTARTAAAIIAAAALAPLVTACSGGPSSTDPTIDSQGEPLFNIYVPRPPPPQVSTAINECERLEPAGSLLAWG